MALLFFALFVSADNAVHRWYKTAYNYSQQGKHKIAFEWMLKAAKVGHMSAQNNIGLGYQHGLGVTKDDKKAFIWFEKAAKQQLPDAQNALAMAYYSGRGTEKNLSKAKQWWLKAAQQNDEYAQFNLASLLVEQKQIELAKYWFAQAQQNQHPNAQKALQELTKYE